MSMTAEKIIQTMVGWIGEDKWKIIDLYNSHRPLAQGYPVQYTDAWCDATVSACFIANDAVELIGGTECGVERHIQLFKQKGIWNEDGTIIPRPGDIICYNWDDPTQPNDGFADHIGIVETVSDQITLIEGNYNGTVGRRTIPIGWGYIRGYAQPRYEEEKQEETKVAKTVIDVSYAQPNVDWDKAKNDIDGAILRCGYGSDIASQDDKQWARNIVEVERLGIPYGVYLYSYADSTAKIQSEIAHCLRLIKGHKPVLGVFLDLEEAKNGGFARTATEAWCKAINAAGYKAGVYTGAYFYKQYMPGVHDKVDALWWIAGYGKNSGVPELAYKPNPGFEYDAWQYTSVKKISGISGGVDCSEWYSFAEDVKPTIQYKTRYWSDYSTDGVMSGTEGESKQIEGIIIDPPAGVELEADVHIQTYGWKTYKGITHGSVIPLGCVEGSKRIEAVRIRCVKNPTGCKLKYQVHAQTYGWMAVCNEGELAGTTGVSKRLEAIRIWFE